MNRTQFRRLIAPVAALALGFALGLLVPRHGPKSAAAPAQAVPIAMPSLELHSLCGVRQPWVWLPFRSPRHVHAVPQCGEPTISRNQADTAPSDAGLDAPMARGSLPNSLAAYSPPGSHGPNLEEPPAYWQPVDVPFTDYPGASAPTKRCKKHHKCKPVTVSFGQVPMGLLVALFGCAAWAARRRVS